MTKSMTTSSNKDKGGKMVKQKKQIIEVHIYVHQVPSGSGGGGTAYPPLQPHYDPSHPNYTCKLNL
jgi:hypothetical protein